MFMRITNLHDWKRKMFRNQPHLNFFILFSIYGRFIDKVFAVCSLSAQSKTKTRVVVSIYILKSKTLNYPTWAPWKLKQHRINSISSQLQTQHHSKASVCCRGWTGFWRVPPALARPCACCVPRWPGGSTWRILRLPRRSLSGWVVTPSWGTRTCRPGAPPPLKTQLVLKIESSLALGFVSARVHAF